MGRMGTSALRREWASSACEWSHMKTLNLKASRDGARISIHREVVEAFQALDFVMLKHGYWAEKHHTGAYNCRKITGGSNYSLHSYGIAADINWQRNPYGRTLITDMSAAMVNDIKNIATRNGVKVFRWGGDYSRNKDAMHFEVVCSRADLRTGIDPTSYGTAEPVDTKTYAVAVAAKRNSADEGPARVLGKWYGLKYVDAREDGSLVDAGKPVNVDWVVAVGLAARWLDGRDGVALTGSSREETVVKTIELLKGTAPARRRSWENTLPRL